MLDPEMGVYKIDGVKLCSAGNDKVVARLVPLS